MRACVYKSILLAFLLSLLFMTSCKKVTITTTLNSDASLQRIISVSGDSTGADETVYPFPQDDSWDMTSHKDSADSYTFFIRKDFTNVYELNKELAYREDTIKINALATLHKRFRWFYTYYRYEETFFKFFPFTGADMLDYVTAEEIEMYYSGNDSTDIEDRIEDYAAHAMFNEFYDAFVRAAEKSSLGIDKTILDQKKEELFSVIMDWDFDDDYFARYFLYTCDEVYALKSFLILESDMAELNQKYFEYFTFISSIIGEGYRVEVQVPGRVIDTNANNSVKNREVVWEFDAEHFHYHDYVMWVEWRKLNVIPTTVTALFVLTGLVLLWSSASRAWRQKLEARGIVWHDRKRFVLRWWMSVALMALGAVLAAWFIWIIMLFNAEPVFLFFDIFDASPQDNVLFVSMVVVGMMLVVGGGWQLVLYYKMKKKNDGPEKSR